MYLCFRKQAPTSTFHTKISTTLTLINSANDRYIIRLENLPFLFFLDSLTQNNHILNQSLFELISKVSLLKKFHFFFFFRFCKINFCYLCKESIFFFEFLYFYFTFTINTEHIIIIIIFQFFGNEDGSTIVKNKLTPAIEARYVRIIPTAYVNGICMRFELYGCPFSKSSFVFILTRRRRQFLLVNVFARVSVDKTPQPFVCRQYDYNFGEISKSPRRSKTARVGVNFI